MTETYNPDPATILAAAEDERHTLLAQAARDHLDRLRAEMDRYRAELDHIEDVFLTRIEPVEQVPEWITANRRADIAAALRLTGAVSPADVADWMRRSDISAKIGPEPAELRRQLAMAASEPARVYRAWQLAQSVLRVAGNRR